MVYLTRRERFSSAHRLFNQAFSEQENIELYGKCTNPNWHGHNYELFVTVKGEINKATGLVINLKDLGRLVKEEVIEKLDHKNLNTEVDYLQGKIVSSEVIVVSIWEILFDKVKNIGATLHKLKLVETENNYVEYYG